LSTLRHALAWIALWAFWVFVSRDHHPTLFIDMVATGLLMLAAAGAFYANLLVLVPRFWRGGRFGMWVLGFLALIAALAVVTAIAISIFYDAAWGPDPTRYGFATKVAMEAAWIAAHALGGMLLVRVFGHKSLRAHDT